MSGTVSRRRVALGIVVVAAAGTVAAWRAGALTPAAASGAVQQGTPAPATAAVTRQELAATTPVTATLGYAGAVTVTGQGGGTLTWLPSPGRVIGQGQALYRTGNGSPVVLLYGGVPDWRALGVGADGADVSQLNHDLVALGYADRAAVAAWWSWPWWSSWRPGRWRYGGRGHSPRQARREPGSRGRRRRRRSRCCGRTCRRPRR